MTCTPLCVSPITGSVVYLYLPGATLSLVLVDSGLSVVLITCVVLCLDLSVSVLDLVCDVIPWFGRN
jgi:hypothetical protein